MEKENKQCVLRKRTAREGGERDATQEGCSQTKSVVTAARLLCYCPLVHLFFNYTNPLHSAALVSMHQTDNPKTNRLTTLRVK